MAKCPITMGYKKNNYGDLVCTTFTSTECTHDKNQFSYTDDKINLGLFELTMSYKICKQCFKLIREHKKWKI